jgi:RimJ/RimL family protein N-acetyltransferase
MIQKRDDQIQLQTERLILRPWQKNDAKTLYKYASDPIIGLNAGWEPHTSIEHSREIICSVFSEDEIYAVVLKETNEPVGCVGFIMGDEKHSTLIGDNDAEVGYWIGIPYWGQGLIPEAMYELIRHGFEDLGLHAIWAGLYDGNRRSKRVADKLGFMYHHTEKEKDNPAMNDIHFYRITKPN